MTGRRISRLEIENFKGFSDTIDLNFDAEIVLLVGPNGRGKTSTIEALELAVTGKIGRRIGGKEEFELRDFIHCNRKSGTSTGEARIRATWSDGSGTDETTIHKSSQSPISSIGPWAALRANELETQSEHDLVRACTFLYSDSLGSLAGLDLDSRRKVIDFFVPSFPELDSLAEIEAQRFSLEITRRLNEIKAELPDVEKITNLEAQRALLAQQSWQALGTAVSAKFVKVNRTLVDQAPLKSALKKICTHLGLEASQDGDYQDTLERIYKAAETRASEASHLDSSETEVHDSPTPRWLKLQAAFRDLETNLPKEHADRRALLLKQSEPRDRLLGDIVELQHIRAAKESEQSSLARSIATIWQPGQEVRLHSSSAHMGLGTLAVLATLSNEDNAATLPSFWSDIGLPMPNHDLFHPHLIAESKRLEELRSRHTTVSIELSELNKKLSDLNALDKINSLFSHLGQLWTENEISTQLPHTPEGIVDLDAVRTRLTSSTAPSIVSEVPPAHSPKEDWASVARAFSTWATVRADVNRATAQTLEQQHLDSARKEVEKAQDIIDHIASNKRGCFKDVFRTNIIEQRYERDLNKSMRQILRWYAHRHDVVEHARIEFQRHGPLQVRIGPKDGISTGISSLSRSQLTSLAFGLAITANLGQPKLPTEFLCLDDVSDAFDLDNLAADAAMLRLLAYGATDSSSHGRRQLILTNHNDHLTNRIVPLLRPPAGRRMRVIEFVDNGHDKSIKTRQWEVIGERQTRWEGRSPLRALLPAISLGATSSPNP
ncbi:hypothetical protein D7W82_17530 [Corallococcus sp. CA049B]|uniref:ATP-binding protein n=1 Tax=Corallococcus sp. CA049B TaxID=2316730 RepID=UPI000EA1311B|nr:ATP-binding protein [Corallococcus sp. CA049B]RKG86133.1 hypothetical protein D7W82_17530 [Corallococcus sp. CA049B]